MVISPNHPSHSTILALKNMVLGIPHFKKPTYNHPDEDRIWKVQKFKSNQTTIGICLKKYSIYFRMIIYTYIQLIK